MPTNNRQQLTAEFAIQLQPLPYQAPMTDLKGQLTMAWTQWFHQLYLRTGGVLAISNPQIYQPQSKNPIYQKHADSTLATTFTSPTGQRTLIDSLTLTNNQPGPRTISIYVFPYGVQFSDPNVDISEYLLGAFDLQGQGTQTVLSNFVLSSGYYIACQASAENSILVSIYGRYIS